MDPAAFLSALLAIVVIDIVLAGDNAIVIALAARSLPPALRRRAIVWGALGAIGVRILMTVVVVWLLQVPGLLVAGGLLLVWIAWRLLVPVGSVGEGPAAAPATFWGAMRTIVVADAVMGLDNVLAVAGAAHGSYLLVVVGLVISVPIVVWGSTLVLRLVDRYPGVIYVGAGVLVWTAVKMVLGEPMLAPGVAAMPRLGILAYLAVPVVLGAAFLVHRRRRAARRHDHGPDPIGPAGAPERLLVPVDGSSDALAAVRHVIAGHRRHPLMHLHVLNIQPRISRHAARFVGRRDCEGWLHDRADRAMSAAVALLTDAVVPHETHRAIGARAEEIVRAAGELGVHRIVIGTGRAGSLARMLDDPVTRRVVATAGVPVEIVEGAAVPTWKRWGVPAGLIGLGGLGGWLLLAAD